MQASYTPGEGLVLGAGRRWLLLDAVPDAETTDALWDLVTGPRVASAAVLDVVAAACGPDAALVLVDLTPGAETSATRGSGRHTTVDGVHTLALGPVDADAPTPARRLVGGVVAAAAVVLVPGSGLPSSAAPGPGPVAGPAAGQAAGLIDGIPPEILASRPVPPTPPPTAPPAPPPALGPVDTDEPPAGAGRRRAEPGGHTVRRGASGPPPPPPAGPGAGPIDSDHDGRTTYRPEDVGRDPTPSGSHLQQSTAETVLAVHCPEGHVTAAYRPQCRVCDAPVGPQEPQRMPRPRLGVLHLPDGERVPLDRGVVLGRQPTPVPGGPRWPHLVRLPAEVTLVSRSHLSVALDGWMVLATDLGSRGGTTLRVPGRVPQRVRAHETYVWEPGQVLDLADSYEIVYEVTA
ncbi:FHA domain-containing protein [Nocardioides sp. 1609]|uniref:FHA domain-containing protein n=1 Tax=Nocardioides sp. 1609 TaxID=2508327 RepID=UPI00106FF0E0|nr:FHA domain-containing protein [Nocardioides sp. 1609]